MDERWSGTGCDQQPQLGGLQGGRPGKLLLPVISSKAPSAWPTPASPQLPGGGGLLPPLSFPQGLQFPGSPTARKQYTGATKCQNVKEKLARPKLPPPPHKNTLTKLCVAQASVPTSVNLSLHLEDKATPRTQDSIGC